MIRRSRPWWLRAYYAEGVRKLRLVNGQRVGPLVDVGGQLAFEVRGDSAVLLMMDREAAKERGDIGRIEYGRDGWLKVSGAWTRTVRCVDE